MSKVLKCPHCRFDNIEYGATVCRACKAEIVYGMTWGGLKVGFVISAFGSMILANNLIGVTGVKQWLVSGLIGGITGCVVLLVVFRNKISFHRTYWHR